MTPLRGKASPTAGRRFDRGADPRSELRFDLAIGELVLDGVSPAGAARIREDLERELAAQLAEHGPELFSGSALARGGVLHLDQARVDLPPRTASSLVGTTAARELALRIASRAHGGEMAGEIALPVDLGDPARRSS